MSAVFADPEPHRSILISAPAPESGFGMRIRMQLLKTVPKAEMFYDWLSFIKFGTVHFYVNFFSRKYLLF